MKSLITILLVLLVFAGCATNQDFVKALDAQRQQVKLVSSSMGQRTFDTSQENLFKAFINAFSNKGLSVVTLEKSTGYMLAEGPQFLNKETLINSLHENFNRFRGATRTSWPTVDLRITVNLYKKEENKTFVKIKINTLFQHCSGCSYGYGYLSRTNCGPLSFPEEMCPLNPSMVRLWYQQLWDEIEKSIFMQRETILK
jgi:hypothetical protein